MAAGNKRQFLLEKLILSREDILKIAEKTIGQYANEQWLLARKLRLTSSKFGLILKASNRNKFSRSLFTNLLEGYDLSNVQAVQWSKENEPIAIQMFEESNNVIVNSTGLWLDPCGFIGASPDGLVDDLAVVEVKCPFKYRNSSLKEA